MTSTTDVEEAIRAVRSSLPECERLIVAVSGGVDSIVLLRALAADRKTKTQLIAAHFRHGTRSSQEHAADRAIVIANAADLSIPVVTGSSAEPMFASPGSGGPEATARQRRYAFLRAVADSCGARTILTAHSRDDQIETVVMRLLSGIDSALLRGIRDDAWYGDYRLIRPLLDVSKQDIVRYARASLFSWREDPTNRSSAFRRNVVRNEILPEARKGWPALDGDLLLLQREMASRDRLTRESAASIPWWIDGDRIFIAGKEFYAADQAVRLHLLYELFTRLDAIDRKNRPSHRFFAPLLAAEPESDGILLEGRGVRISRVGQTLVLHQLLSGLGNDGIFEKQKKERRRKDVHERRSEPKQQETRS